jgi:hypothetical protein
MQKSSLNGSHEISGICVVGVTDGEAVGGEDVGGIDVLVGATFVLMTTGL